MDAVLTLPTNDWRLVSQLALLFNTNDPRALFSVNQRSAENWAGVLDGLVALTNVGPNQVDTVIMTSNSPQAQIIAAGLNRTRNAQPGQSFRNVGDCFATPELSLSSPWLNPNPYSLTDEAMEIIPSQLPGVLRPDPIGSISLQADSVQIQFTGFDGYPYAFEISPDLQTWTAVLTNVPVNGLFTIQETTAEGQRFYRSRLLP